jgi:hypothetical protein
VGHGVDPRLAGLGRCRACPANPTGHHRTIVRLGTLAPSHPSTACDSLWICGQRKGVAHIPAGSASSQYQFDCSGREGLRRAATSRCATFARILIAIHNIERKIIVSAANYYLDDHPELIEGAAETVRRVPELRKIAEREARERCTNMSSAAQKSKA